MAIALSHMTWVTADRAGCRAHCACGWVGATLADWPDAEAAGVEHREAAARPATELDRLCSELLGVMDDLAEVVSWLAETWPDDLPAPGWLANGSDYLDGPAFMVRAFCRDLDVLARAAATLGVATVDDPTIDGRGNRYRRAGRSFGRVLVEAYGPLHSDDEAVA